MATATTRYGVHSEVGRLRKVMVCRPGLAHLRLTPDNCHDLLFDDVIWVHEAQTEHYNFCQLMRERGVEVLEMHDLLATTLEDAQARAWVLDRKINPNTVALLGLDELRAWLDGMPAAELAERLIGGIANSEIPVAPYTTLRRAPRSDRASSCPRCRTRCSPATPPAGSTAASPSTRCTGRPGARRPC